MMPERIHHDDAVDDGQPDLGAVLDDDEGGAGLRRDVGDGVAHLAHADGVEVGRRLVEQDEAGVHGDDAGEGEALLLAARELRGVVTERRGEADPGEGPGDAPPDVGARNAQVLHAERHVVADPRQDHLRVGVLQDHADAVAPAVGAGAVDQEAAVLVAVLAAAEHAGQAVQQGGLAGTRRAEQQHALAGFDGEVEVADRPVGAAGVTPRPALGAHRRAATAARAVWSIRHGQALRVRASRPEANRLRAPVRASPRTTSQESRPATMAPERMAATM